MRILIENVFCQNVSSFIANSLAATSDHRVRKIGKTVTRTSGHRTVFVHCWIKVVDKSDYAGCRQIICFCLYFITFRIFGGYLGHVGKVNGDNVVVGIINADILNGRVGNVSCKNTDMVVFVRNAVVDIECVSVCILCIK